MTEAASPVTLMSHAEYLAALRPLLPKGIFRPKPERVLHILLHLSVVVIGYLLLRMEPAWYLSILIAVVIGHSLGALGLLGHDLTHKTILTKAYLRYPLEILVWSLIWMAPTMWNKVHNLTHHLETNTEFDSDRPFFTHEKTWLRSIHSRLFFPHKNGWIWSPLVFIYFFIWVISNNISAFLSGERRFPFLPYKKPYSTKEKCSLAFELILMVGVQFLIFYLVGSNWRAYIWASPVAVYFSSVLVMGYIFTHHLLNPFTDEVDPVLSTTSVEVPKIADWLHSNISYHTEHHLFPGMNAENYPVVCDLLKKTFPARYNRLAFGTAWRKLWKGEEYLKPEKVLHVGDRKL